MVYACGFLSIVNACFSFFLACTGRSETVERPFGVLKRPQYVELFFVSFVSAVSAQFCFGIRNFACYYTIECISIFHYLCDYRFIVCPTRYISAAHIGYVHPLVETNSFSSVTGSAISLALPKLASCDTCTFSVAGWDHVHVRVAIELVSNTRYVDF